MIAELCPENVDIADVGARTGSSGAIDLVCTVSRGELFSKSVLWIALGVGTGSVLGTLSFDKDPHRRSGERGESKLDGALW